MTKTPVKTKPAAKAKAAPKPPRPTSLSTLRQVRAALDRSAAAVETARNTIAAEIVRLTP